MGQQYHGYMLNNQRVDFHRFTSLPWLEDTGTHPDTFFVRLDSHLTRILKIDLIRDLGSEKKRKNMGQCGSWQ